MLSRGSKKLLDDIRKNTIFEKVILRMCKKNGKKCLKLTLLDWDFSENSEKLFQKFL